MSVRKLDHKTCYFLLFLGEVSKFDAKYDNYLANGIEFFKDLKYTIKACGDKKFKEIFDRHDKKSQEAFENMWKERRRNK